MDTLKVSLNHLQIQSNSPSDTHIYPLGSGLSALLFLSECACSWLEGIERETACEKQTEKSQMFRSIQTDIHRANQMHTSH